MNQKSKWTEEWESGILHGLSCEWEKALWVLSPEYRKRMHPPLFSFQDMHKSWGSWSREKREISLSRDLVFHHSWDAVLEVLLHEVAHQFADEVFIAHSEPPHGPLFQKACCLLRANPKASGNFKLINERISQEASRMEDRIGRRVKKLMALAGSPNQYEAEAAMARRMT